MPSALQAEELVGFPGEGEGFKWVKVLGSCSLGTHRYVYEAVSQLVWG